MSHTPGISFTEVFQHQPGCPGCGAWKSSAYQLTLSNAALLAALKEAGNACNACAAHDPANRDYWFKKQQAVDAALTHALGGQP